ncbi:MAG TPA: GNAT family N-acetyltransferase [Acidimicrobiales bacterium]|nr:GNAT family N-acetyltransferase [Acidimicrobiales bacterium]
MSDADGSGDVQDVPSERRFVIRQHGATAELVYGVAPGRLTLIHTGVPDELSGRGVGGRLVRAALERAVREGLTVVPQCSYVRQWMKGHADEASTVTVDWT